MQPNASVESSEPSVDEVPTREILGPPAFAHGCTRRLPAGAPKGVGGPLPRPNETPAGKPAEHTSSATPGSRGHCDLPLTGRAQKSRRCAPAKRDHSNLETAATLLWVPRNPSPTIRLHPQEHLQSIRVLRGDHIRPECQLTARNDGLCPTTTSASRADVDAIAVDERTICCSATGGGAPLTFSMLIKSP